MESTTRDSKTHPLQLTPLAIAILAGGFFSQAAFAQIVPPGAQTDPLLIERQQRDTKRLQDERERLLSPPRRPVETPARPAVKPTASDARFMLKSVDFGPSVFLTEAQLQEIAAPYVGKEVSFNALNEMVEQINKLYIDQGQVFSRAFLPPQRVDDGRVRINMVEAKADNVQVEGDKYISRDWIDSLLDSNKGEVINALKLDRTLDRFQRGTEARFAIDVEPGATTGTSALKVKVAEPDRWKLRASLSNEGNDNTAREQATADLTLFSPLGRGDRAGLGLLASRGLKSLNATYLVQVNTWGTRVAGSLSTARTKIVEGPFAINDIRGESRSSGLQIVHPLFDKRPWQLEATGGYSLSHSETSIGGVSLGDSKVQQYSAGLQMQRLDGVNDVSASIAWVPFRSTAPAGGVTRSAKLEWSGTYVRRMEGIGAVLLRANGQSARSATPLASSGQLSFGGAGLLRAYPAGSLIGESGYGMSLEFHSAFSDTLGWSVFAERGEVWGGVARQSLTDIGGGLEWRAREGTQLTATVAHGLNDGTLTPKQNRVYIKIAQEF